MLQTAYYPSGAVAVTPSDTDELNLVGIYVGGTGDVSVTDTHGVTTVFSAAPAGFKMLLGITRVNATDTTATNIVGFVS